MKRKISFLLLVIAVLATSTLNVSATTGFDRSRNSVSRYVKIGTLDSLTEHRIGLGPRKENYKSFSINTSNKKKKANFRIQGRMYEFSMSSSSYRPRGEERVKYKAANKRNYPDRLERSRDTRHEEKITFSTPSISGYKLNVSHKYKHNKPTYTDKTTKTKNNSFEESVWKMEDYKMGLIKIRKWGNDKKFYIEYSYGEDTDIRQTKISSSGGTLGKSNWTTTRNVRTTRKNTTHYITLTYTKK